MGHSLLPILEAFARRRVLVIGEAMLDAYLHGHTQRLCREAPVPVVDVAAVEDVPGGGANAAFNARALGAPSSVTLWCDVEWSSASAPTDPQPVLDYINAWAAQVVAGGYRAGLYVGPNVPVDGKSLYYDLPKITGYWKAASKTSWVAERGFQIIQGLSFTTAEGLDIDPDMAAYDGRGDRCTVIAPS